MIPNSTFHQILTSPLCNHWKKVGIKHHHGFNLSLSSLRSSTSTGIGEYTDLIPLIDWCGKIGFDIIQLLPLNDSGLDASPYNAISAFALNPIHLGISFLPHIEESRRCKLAIQDLKKFNITPHVMYKEVYKRKEQLLYHYFKEFGHRIIDRAEYKNFIEANSWVKTYSLFKVLYTEQKYSNWQEWPIEFQESSDSLILQYLDKVEFHTFVQFLCFEQFRTISAKAYLKGVLIKGDIPILISPNSADVWSLPHYFDLHHSAGAPPDMYAKEGQNWGFPLYRWHIMEQEDYVWWKKRLMVASQFYHLYRLDHIVGFFRIWGIPKDKKATEGFFIPSDHSTWIYHGEKILRMMIQSCTLLPIGEDLGTIPPEVRVCLNHLTIPGTKVMRWERYYHGDKSFIKPEHYPPISMTTISTHDSESVQLWWKNQPLEAQDFAFGSGWNQEEVLSLEHLKDILWTSHHTASLFHINLLQEYLALIPGMTHANLEDERINIPGTITSTNWNYRFIPSVEQICNDESLQDLMRYMVE